MEQIRQADEVTPDFILDFTAGQVDVGAAIVSIGLCAIIALIAAAGEKAR